MLTDLLKITYCAMMREVESDLESVSEARSPPKVNGFFLFVRAIVTPTFNEVG